MDQNFLDSLDSLAGLTAEDNGNVPSSNFALLSHQYLLHVFHSFDSPVQVKTADNDSPHQIFFHRDIIFIIAIKMMLREIEQRT
jgi:hypothetical protein